MTAKGNPAEWSFEALDSVPKSTRKKESTVAEPIIRGFLAQNIEHARFKRPEASTQATYSVLKSWLKTHGDVHYRDDGTRVKVSVLTRTLPGEADPSIVLLAIPVGE